ncbi:hypothetical protein WJX73_006837 [Symbiochloris irregularis]|uniref:Universal stress protein n=1 Tax=Symbiochloris irregularis TaxID=706552 RepID=A0AAW1Q0C2_9CHLO
MRYCVPVDICQASLLTVKPALRLARNGDEVYLLYVQLESADTQRDKAEEELHQLFEPVLNSATGVQCYLHAVCIRDWQAAGCSAEELVARAICAKARSLQATVVMAGQHRSAACLGQE